MRAVVARRLRPLASDRTGYRRLKRAYVRRRWVRHAVWTKVGVLPW